MNWSELTQKQKQLVLITVVLAIAWILVMAHFFGWTKPKSARGGSVRQEVTGLQTKIAAARTLLLRKGAIGAAHEAGTKKLEELAVHVPASSDRYAWAYEYVSRCATQAKASLDSLEEVSDSESGKIDPFYEIKVMTLCGYNNLVEFLWRLEKDNPLLRIKEVKIASVPGSPQTQRVNILIQWPSSVKVERGTK